MTVYSWSDWKPLDPSYEVTRESERRHYGIHQVGIVDAREKAIPIGRLDGVDDEGILYIGRSGFPDAASPRSIAQRLREFLKGAHSGAETYDLVAKSRPFRTGPFSSHGFRYRTAYFRIRPRIEDAEVEALADYFKEYAELPPCNSSITGKSGAFRRKLGDA